MSEFFHINIQEITALHRGKIAISTNNKSCCVLSCRLSGSAIFNTPERSFEVNRGDVMFIPRGSSYTQQTQGEEIIYIHFDVLGNTSSRIRHIVPANADDICDLFQNIQRTWSMKEKNYQYLCTAQLYNIIAMTDILPDRPNAGILQIPLQYIHEHFCDPDFSVKKVCQVCHISQGYFNRLFKATVNATPVSYINRLKVEKAKPLLLSRTYTHNEIASLCGFSDIKYFYTVFKKITGICAGKYQKQ